MRPFVLPALALLLAVAACRTEREAPPAGEPPPPPAAAGETTTSPGGEPAANRDGAPAASGAAVSPPAPPLPGDTVPADTLDPVAVVRAYYAAIGAGRYPEAYRYWSGGGAASGQTYDEFRRGFASTGSVRVEAGPPGRIEGAAGSRYVEVPVVVTAETTDGQEQRFEGKYVLRRSVVEGATPEQRSWRIYSADVARVR